MTWNANLKVTDVSDDDDGGPIVIEAVAEGDDVTSNTEGTITGVKVEFTFEGETAPLAVGDSVNANGSFSPTTG